MQSIQEFRNFAQYCREAFLKHRRRRGAESNLLRQRRGGAWADVGELEEREPFLFAADPEPLRVSTELTEGLHETDPYADTADKLSRLVQQVEIRPHEGELVYGYPCLLWRDGGDVGMTPLLLFPTEARFVPAESGYEVEIVSTEAEFVLSPFLDALGLQEGELELLNKRLEQVWPTPPFADEALRKLESGLADVVGRKLSRREAWSDRLTPIREARSELTEDAAEEARVVLCGVLLRQRRPEPLLLQDLDQLAAMTEAPRDCALVSMLELPTETDPIEEREERHPGECIFPLDGSRYQEDAARRAEALRLSIIEGPPGTGKSHTIANVVAHLVSQGQSVLVSSRKTKALEVVSHMLRRMEAPGVFVEWLREDRESRSRFADALDELDWRRRRTSAERPDNQQLLGRVDAFEAERQAEHEYGPKFERWFEEGVDADDALSSHDTREDGRDAQRRAAALRDWARAAGTTIRVGVSGQELDVSHPALATDEQVRALQQQAQEYVEKLLELRTLVRQAPDECRNAAEALPRTGLETGAAAHHARVLEEAANALLDARDTRRREDGWTSHELEASWELAQLTPHTRSAASETLARMRQDFEWAQPYRDLQPWPYAVGPDDVIRLLGEPPPSGLARLLGRKSELAKALGLDCEPNEQARGTLAQHAQGHKRWLALADRTERHAAELPTQLGPQSLGVSWRTGDAAHWETDVSRAEALLAHANLVARVRAACAPLETLVAVESFHPARSDARIRSFVTRCRIAIHAACSYVELYRMWREGNVNALAPLLPSPQTAFTDKLGAESVRAKAAAVLAAWTCKRAETRELANLPTTLDELRRHFLETGAWPSWVSDAERVFQARAARRTIEAHRSSTSTDDIARHIAGMRDELRDRSRAYLQSSLDGCAEYARRPSVHRGLQQLKQLLRRTRTQFRTWQRIRNGEVIPHDDLVRLFPCWVVTPEEVPKWFPMSPGIFDVVIIDEASQCSIPSALPLLFRAKRAVIVGDPKQMQADEYTWFPEAEVRALLERFPCTTLAQPETVSVRSSLLDLASVRARGRTFLGEHFRSYPELVAFSNAEFYQNRLRPMRTASLYPLGAPIHVERVDGATEERRRNLREAEAVLAKLQGLMADPQYQERRPDEPMTFGVLSPYRDQVDELTRLAAERVTPSARSRHQLRIGTPDEFQGDERDVILYSFCYGPTSEPRSFHPLQRDAGRVNVALTRARDQIWCFVSRPVHEFPRGLYQRFLEYAEENHGRAPKPDVVGKKDDLFDSEFEESVATALREKGLSVATQWPSCGYKIDLVVSDQPGRMLAVECDGPHHFDEWGQQEKADWERQEVLERAGWAVLRVPMRGWYEDRARWVRRVMDRLSELALPEHEATASTTDEQPRAPSVPEAAPIERADRDVVVPHESPDHTSPQTAMWASIDRVPSRARRDALLAALEAGPLTRDELLKAASVSLGFARLTGKMRTVLNRVIGGLLGSGQLVEEGDRLRRRDTVE